MEGKATTFLTSLLDRGLAATYGTASKDGTKGTEAATGDDVDETAKSSSYSSSAKEVRIRLRAETGALVS